MFYRKIIKVYDNNVDIVKSNSSQYHRCSLKLIFYCEDIYIDRIYIPAVKKKWIGQMIKNNLIANFDDIGKLCYSYDITHKSANKYCISLYCINSKKNQLFDVANNKFRVEGVYLIQFCYLYYIQRQIKFKDFLLIFNAQNYTYILLSVEGTLESSSVVKSDQLTLNNTIDAIEMNLKNIKENKAGNTIPVLFVNYQFKDYVNVISQLYYVKDVGNVNEDKLIRKYTGVL